MIRDFVFNKDYEPCIVSIIETDLSSNTTIEAWNLLRLYAERDKIENFSPIPIQLSKYFIEVNFYVFPKEEFIVDNEDNHGSQYFFNQYDIIDFDEEYIFSYDIGSSSFHFDTWKLIDDFMGELQPELKYVHQVQDFNRCACNYDIGLLTRQYTDEIHKEMQLELTQLL